MPFQLLLGFTKLGSVPLPGLKVMVPVPKVTVPFLKPPPPLATSIAKMLFVAVTLPPLLVRILYSEPLLLRKLQKSMATEADMTRKPLMSLLVLLLLRRRGKVATQLSR